MAIYCKTDLISFGNSLTERPDPARFERHCHQKYEILYVSRGKGKCIVEGIEHPIFHGSLFIFRPFEYHYVCPDPDSVYERYVCNFSENALMDAVRSLPMLSDSTQGLHFYGEGIASNFCNVASIIESFAEKNDPKSSQSEAMAVSAVNQLLLLLSRESGSTDESAGNELVGRIIEYLNRNLEQKISLEETAKHFFISKYYLCRLFRRHTGVTVLSYLNSKKIAKAQHLILSGEPPSSVAYAVGFGDYSSFYRLYKKTFGVSPQNDKTILS